MSNSDHRISRLRARSTPCRVLVVDDSAFMRRLVSEVIDGCAEFHVVGTARDGLHAMEQVRLLDPDVVTLDVHMPQQDGLATLQQLMRETPRPVVMLSAGGNDEGADATLRALELGAVEFVRKPSGQISLTIDEARAPLLAALRAASSMNRGLLRRWPTITPSARHPDGAGATGRAASHVICIGSSTGGPAALAQIVPALPIFPHVAVLIAQHMPPGFTASLARRLDRSSRLVVREAVQHETIVAGHVYIAPGGRHLRVNANADGSAHCVLDDGPTVWGIRPSADLLFGSAATVFRERCIAVVLTGMGCDGAEGMRMVRANGGLAVVQEATTCVVDGMPSAARRVGNCAVVRLDEMAVWLTTAVLDFARVGDIERLALAGDTMTLPR